MTTETRPLVAVERADLRTGRGSVLGPDTDRRTAWYALRLACGHVVERSVKYRADERLPKGQRWARSRGAHEALPAPKRARCDECPGTT